MTDVLVILRSILTLHQSIITLWQCQVSERGRAIVLYQLHWEQLCLFLHSVDLRDLSVPLCLGLAFSVAQVVKDDLFVVVGIRLSLALM